MEFHLQWPRIIQLNSTGRSNRMQKLQEEQGELAGAIQDGRRREIMSESIDVWLMLLSIYADHDPGAPGFGSTVASHFDIAITNYEKHGAAVGDNVVSRYLELSACIGRVAEVNQKIDGVASSSYKLKENETPGNLERLRLALVFSAIQHILHILTFIEISVADIQAEYDRKMDKWERVSASGN